MANVFVSYSHKDLDIISPFIRYLEACELSVFWDVKLRVGDIWRKLLVEEHLASECVIVFWTINSVKSHWVFDEAIAAVKSSKIIPVLLGNVDIPPGFTGINHFEFIEDDLKNHTRTLARAVNEKINSNKNSQYRQLNSRSISTISSQLKKNEFSINLKERKYNKPKTP